MSYAAVSENANRAGRRTIIIDMRCLQDRRYGERGIAAHSRNTVALARGVSALARGAWIAGLTDPELEPLAEELAGLVDEVIRHGYLPGMPPGTIFLQLSPMSEDQIFIARLLLDRNIRKAVLVYDFIPYDDQPRYLADPRKRMDYFTAMAWLKHYDLFLPISADAGRRLQELYPRARGAAVVTGVPLAPSLETAGGGKATHILTVAGEDARKNPFVLIRAHAASRYLQKHGIALVIAGNYLPLTRRMLFDLVEECGGDKDLVRIPGKVSPEVLHALYRDSICVVSASRAEGFSMPVIEAMAAGVPSIASDIAVHAALIDDPALRFDPDDAAGLMKILERLGGDAAYRHAVVQAQAEVWPNFRAGAVAARIWTAIENLPALPSISAPRRPAVAMLTPLPPARSGVANYSAELAKWLGERVDLTLYSSTPGSTVPAVSGLPHLSGRFDRVISVMGNSIEHHGGIYDLAVRYGGACICHDARLLGLTTTRLGLARAANIASAELGRVVSEAEVYAWAGDEQQREADFLGELATAARPMIFHARPSVDLLKQRFGLDAVFLPFAIYLPFAAGWITPAAKALAREKLGLAPAEKLICSFGGIDPIKGIEPALRAMALLRRDGVQCRLLWIGAASVETKVFEARAERLGVGREVYFSHDYISAAMFRDYLLAADCGLQLRVGRPGNISGALQDCIAAGLPSVASADLAANLQAPSYISRVGDRLDPVEIAAALRRLIEAGAARDAFEEEREAYCARHSMANYAASLCEVLAL